MWVWKCQRSTPDLWQKLSEVTDPQRGETQDGKSPASTQSPGSGNSQDYPQLLPFGNVSPSMLFLCAYTLSSKWISKCPNT